MVSDLKTFAHKGGKIAGQKKFVFRRILPYLQDFFGIRATIRIGREMLCLPYAGFFVEQFTMGWAKTNCKKGREVFLYYTSFYKIFSLLKSIGIFTFKYFKQRMGILKTNKNKSIPTTVSIQNTVSDVWGDIYRR